MLEEDVTLNGITHLIIDEVRGHSDTQPGESR